MTKQGLQWLSGAEDILQNKREIKQTMNEEMFRVICEERRGEQVIATSYSVGSREGSLSFVCVIF